MNFDAILEPAIAFSSDGIGAVLAELAKALYHVLYPANAEAATKVEIPA